MRLLIPVLLLAGLLVAQDKKPAPGGAGTVPTLADKDRADFLLIQRDWMATQKQYEDAFKREPIVGKYEAAIQKLNKECSDGGGQFNPQMVVCDHAVPKPEAAKPEATKTK